jgi:multidrug efflux pump subunit AcrA (membrane-fusion protein)
MKNAIIAILVVATVVVGYIAATSKLRLSLEGLEGKTEKVTRGNLTLPINATGEIRADRRVVIKAEASGEVIEIAKQPGDVVKSGDLLIRLKRDDEERNVNRARLEFDRAGAVLEERKILLRQAETADLAAAKASVDQIKANLELAKVRAERAETSPELYHDEERLQRRTTYEHTLAQLGGAQAAYEKTQLAVPRAVQTVKQAEAALESAKQTLGDAQERLSETDIRSPIDGIVGQIQTQVGEVIQGGRTTITGGTQLAVILDMDKLVVRAEVDEADIGRVLAIAPEWAKPGHDATIQVPEDLRAAAQTREHLPSITVESFRDEEFDGIIERIFPEPSALSGVVTYLVDVVIISQNQDRLLPGMRADVSFTSEHVEDVVLCPNEAIREGAGGKLGVYVPKPGADPDEHPTEFIPCKFGLDNGNYSEVREGLTEGMVVYTRLPARPNEDRD